MRVIDVSWGDGSPLPSTLGSHDMQGFRITPTKSFYADTTKDDESATSVTVHGAKATVGRPATLNTVVGSSSWLTWQLPDGKFAHAWKQSASEQQLGDFANSLSTSPLALRANVSRTSTTKGLETSGAYYLRLGSLWTVGSAGVVSCPHGADFDFSTNGAGFIGGTERCLVVNASVSTLRTNLEKLALLSESGNDVAGQTPSGLIIRGGQGDPAYAFFAEPKLLVNFVSPTALSQQGVVTLAESIRVDTSPWLVH